VAVETLFGERSLSKVSAVFADAEQARRAADELVNGLGLSQAQVEVVKPHDPRISHKLEPESRGIAVTLVRTHAVLGAAGAGLGLILAAVLVLSGNAAAASSPFYTLLVFVFFGGIFGMLLGGLIALRPDHDPMIARVERAARKGRWSVVVHARDHDEEHRAKEALDQMSNRVTETL
jgi:hypothetical protein